MGEKYKSFFDWWDSEGGPESLGKTEKEIALIGWKTAINNYSFEEKLKQRIKPLEEKVRIYDIQIWAAMKAQSLGLCKKCLSHAIRDIKALEGEDG